MCGKENDYITARTNSPLCGVDHGAYVLAEQREENLCVVCVELFEQCDGACDERYTIYRFSWLLTD